MMVMMWGIDALLNGRELICKCMLLYFSPLPVAALPPSLQLQPGDLHPSSRMLWSKRPAKKKHPDVAAKPVPKRNAAGAHAADPGCCCFLCI